MQLSALSIDRKNRRTMGDSMIKILALRKSSSGVSFLANLCFISAALLFCSVPQIISQGPDRMPETGVLYAHSTTVTAVMPLRPQFICVPAITRPLSQVLRSENQQSHVLTPLLIRWESFLSIHWSPGPTPSRSMMVHVTQFFFPAQSMIRTQQFIFRQTLFVLQEP